MWEEEEFWCAKRMRRCDRRERRCGVGGEDVWCRKERRCGVGGRESVV